MTCPPDVRLSAVKLRRSYPLIVLVLAIPTSMALGQTGFEDSESKTSLIVLQGGIGKVNVTDSRVSFGYQYARSESAWRFGGEFFGKLSEGVGSLFEGGQVVPEAGLKVTATHTFGKLGSWVRKLDPCQVPNQSWLTVQAGYSRSQFKMVSGDPTSTLSAADSVFDSFEGTIYLNRIVLDGDGVFGASIGIKRVNNLDALEKISLSTEIRTFHSGDTTQVIQTSSEGSIAEGYTTRAALIANFDIVWIPRFLSDRFAIDFLTRFDSQKSGLAVFKPGIGLYVLEDGAPTRVVAGVSVEVTDLNSVIQGLRVGLVAGFQF